jgi:hypothetical protein
MSSAVDGTSVMASDPCMDIISGPALLPDPVLIGGAIFVVAAVDPEVFFQCIVTRGGPKPHRCFVRLSSPASLRGYTISVISMQVRFLQRPIPPSSIGAVVRCTLTDDVVRINVCSHNQYSPHIALQVARHPERSELTKHMYDLRRNRNISDRQYRGVVPRIRRDDILLVPVPLHIVVHPRQISSMVLKVHVENVPLVSESKTRSVPRTSLDRYVTAVGCPDLRGCLLPPVRPAPSPTARPMITGASTPSEIRNLRFDRPQTLCSTGFSSWWEEGPTSTLTFSVPVTWSPGWLTASPACTGQPTVMAYL